MSFRFIVIDDAAFIRELLKTHLSASGGVCVGEADDGATALTLAASTLPDLVVVDVVLPGMNAVQLLPLLRMNCAQAKFLVCSSLNEEMIVEQCMEAGADAFLLKPFEKKDLHRILINFNLMSKEAIK